MSDQIFVNMENLAKDAASLNYFDKNLQPKGYLPIRTDITASYKKLDEILSLVNLKRACCLRTKDPDNPNNYLINIRKAKPAGTTINTGTVIGQIYNKFGFIDEKLSIPKSYCSSQLPSTFLQNMGLSCQNFYTVYCKNITNEYKTAANKTDSTFDYTEFSYYKPECACYAPKPTYMTNAGVNAAPICYIPGCDSIDGVYLDPVSSSPENNCNLSICQLNIDMSDFRAGGNIDIENKIEQNCGPNGSTTTPQQPTSPIITLLTQITTPFANLSAPITNSAIGKMIDSKIPGLSSFIIYIICGIVCIIFIFVIVTLIIALV